MCGGIRVDTFCNFLGRQSLSYSTAQGGRKLRRVLNHAIGLTRTPAPFLSRIEKLNDAFVGINPDLSLLPKNHSNRGARLAGLTKSRLYRFV